jgi:hypothetical protein
MNRNTHLGCLTVSLWMSGTFTFSCTSSAWTKEEVVETIVALDMVPW